MEEYVYRVTRYLPLCLHTLVPSLSQPQQSYRWEQLLQQQEQHHLELLGTRHFAVVQLGPVQMVLLPCRIYMLVTTNTLLIRLSESATVKMSIS